MNLSSTCFYCAKNFSEPKFIATVYLYKRLDNKLSLDVTGVKRTKQFLKKEFQINRCESCYKIHSTPNLPALIFAFLFAVISGILIYYYTTSFYISIPLGIVAFILALIGFLYFTYRRKIKKLGTKDVLDFDDYPGIKELLNDGWDRVQV